MSPTNTLDGYLGEGEGGGEGGGRGGGGRQGRGQYVIGDIHVHVHGTQVHVYTDAVIKF